VFKARRLVVSLNSRPRVIKKKEEVRSHVELFVEALGERHLRVRGGRVVKKTLIIYNLGFGQNYYTFTLILLMKIVLCSKFH